MSENLLLFTTPINPKYSFEVIRKSNNLTTISFVAIFFLIILRLFSIIWFDTYHIKQLNELEKIVFLGGISFGIGLRIVVIGMLIVNVVNKVFNIPIDYEKGIAIVSISSLPFVVVPMIVLYFHLYHFLFLANVLTSILISFGIVTVYKIEQKKMLSLTVALLLMIYFVKFVFIKIQIP